MKHLSLVARGPKVAQSTPLQIKVDFMVSLVDRGVTYVFQKDSAL